VLHRQVCDRASLVYAPGQHGQKSGQRLSDYGVHLREKQKIRRIYGVLEGQFRKVYKEADRRKGVTGETCCSCSNRVWIPSLSHGLCRIALGIASGGSSQRRAGQWSSCQYSVLSGSPGRCVEVAEKAKNQLRVKAALEAAESRGFPEWVEVDVKEAKGTYKARPERSELPPTINESLVIDFTRSNRGSA
jgi:small subunit ribosomal protein S4